MPGLGGALAWIINDAAAARKSRPAPESIPNTKICQVNLKKCHAYKMFFNATLNGSHKLFNIAINGKNMLMTKKACDMTTAPKNKDAIGNTENSATSVR